MPWAESFLLLDIVLLASTFFDIANIITDKYEDSDELNDHNIIFLKRVFESVVKDGSTWAVLKI